MIENVKKLGIIGFGQSGVSLATMLRALGKGVVVSEEKDAVAFAPELIHSLRQQGVMFEFSGHTKKCLSECDLIVLSPGVDTNKSQAIKIIQELALPSVGEIELCSWLTKARIVAITGTNGKTTVSSLTYKVLKEKRKRVFLGGNIGIPFSSFVLETKKNDVVVLEISSFQLETIISFGPYVSCLLNLEPDHLDRYDSFTDYVGAKKNIFRNQKSSDWAVLNKHLLLRKEIEKDIKAQIRYFSSECENENFSAVYRIASLFNIDKLFCQKVFSQFKGLAHRLQFVRRLGGVDFINDSKATNPASTIWALKNIKRPIILIAGGKDKGVDYRTIFPYLRTLRKINLFGEASEKMSEVFSGKVETKIFPSLEDVVQESFAEAKKGDVILLSPMCSSFDMFANYKERGDKFMEIVQAING